MSGNSSPTTRKGWFKDAIENLLRNASSGVPNRDEHLFAVAMGADRDRSPMIEPFDGTLNQSHKHLIEVAWVAINLWKNAKHALHRYALFQFMPQQSKCAVNPFVQVCPFKLGLVQPREALKAVYRP